MRTPDARRFLALVVLAAIATSVEAQTPTPAAESNRPSASANQTGYWLSIDAGAGGATEEGGGLLLGASAHLQQRSVLWSLRWDGVATGWNSDVVAVSLLAGHATTDDSPRYSTLSAGVGFVSHVACRGYCGLFSAASDTIRTHNTFGLSVAGEIGFRTGGRGGVGIGLTSVANINPEASFVALGVTVSGGRWR